MFSIQNIGNYILSRVTQEDIFHRYLYIRPVIKKLICSPSILRVDKNPTCEFRWSNGWLRLIDYGGYFSGNCFDVVMKLYNVNYYEACEIIKRDFTLDKREASVEYSTKKKQEKGTSGINAQAFTETDKLYWDKYYCEEQILRDKFFVYSCKNIYWNGKIIYTYTSSDPGYGYYFGNGNWKFYFPFRKKHRFMQNSACVEGINLIPKSGNTLVVTKSYKDVIILTQFGVPSISPPGESSREAIEVVKELSYNKIISLMDFDYTGIKSANHLRKTYGIEPYFLTNGRFSTPDYGAKDISDYLFKLKKLQNENS